MKSSMRLAALVVIAASLVLTGCASIVSGTNQVVSVEARNKTEQVPGASCKLENGKGVYYVTTPGTVTVHRAYDDMKVRCEKENSEPGMATVKSTTKPMAFGNIIFGGVIGAAIDTGSGAAYDYPPLISVIMGETTNIQAEPVKHARRGKAEPQASAANPAPGAPLTQ
ncbi:hypothetical protein ABC383_28175 [Noviherbaspirillum sp. 1P10PC]|uniref:hypothetical protein n=1 Tax=Noviherbaspirillum sp. 1P10PC TaxID=3132292 RepID=UPI0039A1D6AC